METFLNGKVAVVTGATRGIGLAVANSLLEAGASVVICGRSQDGLNRAIRQLSERADGRVAGTRADVGKLEDVQNLFRTVDQKFGGLDILVNNAGIGIFGPTADLTPEQWREVIDTNLNGAFYCSREAIARFRKRGAGFIVNISSLAGKNPFTGGAAYNASKFGLNGFTEAMMLDHRYDNVRVSYVMPGSVDTEFNFVPRSSGSDWKIAPQDIAEIVLAILRMPERTLISRVEVRPSRPKK